MKKLKDIIREAVQQYIFEETELKTPENSELFDKVNDNLIWVKVLNGEFFFEKDCDGANFGINCQTSVANNYCGGGEDGLDTFQLLSKHKNENDFCFKTVGAITLNKNGKFVVEMRQRGNQLPGSNSVDNFSKEQMVDLFLDFMIKHFPDIDKFSSGAQLNIPQSDDLKSDGSPNSSWGWSAKSLWYIMKNYPNKFSKYINKVPGIFLNHVSMIEKTLGEDFLLLDKDVDDIFKENKYNFFKIINTLLKIKKEETVSLLKNLNYEELLKDEKILQSITKNLFVYIDFLTPKNIQILLNKINIKEIVNSDIANFSSLCKKLSEKGGEYKKILFNFINDNLIKIIDALGGRGVGLGRIMTILNSPKYKKHEDAKYNFDSGDYEFIFKNPETSETTKKTLSDDNLVFNNSERKKILEQNKDLIKSFFNLPNQNEEIEYLRFLIPNLPESGSKYQLEKIKDEFIAYYDNKFDKDLQKYPGKFLYNQLMNQLKIRLGEKGKKISYSWSEIWKNAFFEKFPFKDNQIIVSDLNYNDRFDKQTLQSVLKYFYKELKSEYGEYKHNPEKNSFSFVPAVGKSDELKKIMSDYFYILGSLSGFGEEEVKNWIATLIKNKFPLVSPNPKVVNWVKNKRLFSEKSETIK